MPLSRVQLPNVIGEFFQKLALSLLRARSSATTKEGDGYVKINDQFVLLEVKSGNPRNQFRVDLRQLEGYLEMIKGFPYDACWYVFVTYQNRVSRSEKSGKRQSMLVSCKTREDVWKVLKTNILSLQIVDVRIIEAIAKKYPPVDNMLFGQKESLVILVPRKILSGLTGSEWRNNLIGLDLDPDHYRVEHKRKRNIKDVGGEGIVIRSLLCNK